MKVRQMLSGRLVNGCIRLALSLIIGLALFVSVPATVQADGVTLTMTFTLNQ